MLYSNSCIPSRQQQDGLVFVQRAEQINAAVSELQRCYSGAGRAFPPGARRSQG
jgi:hypothetical protein